MTGTRHTFTSYFTLAIEMILKALWTEGYRRDQRMMGLIWNRLRRLERRFNALVAQWRAGTLPARGTESTPHPAPPPQGGRENRTVLPPSPFPRAYAWIIRQFIPQSKVSSASALYMAMVEPEMAELYAAAPGQLGRILRPLCHMIGAHPLPEWLKLPKRVRVRKKKEPLPPHPATAHFPDTPAARSAARALARMQAGLPVDLTKLSSVAYGYFVHPPKDSFGLSPPREIGYARSRLRLPKDHDPKKWD